MTFRLYQPVCLSRVSLLGIVASPEKRQSDHIYHRRIGLLTPGTLIHPLFTDYFPAVFFELLHRVISAYDLLSKPTHVRKLRP